MSTSQSLGIKRRLLADYCRLLGGVFTGRHEAPAASSPAGPELDQRTAGLSPREQQTLLRLLAGDSEKEIAIHLEVSKHTIHVYVKNLYRHFDVNSRGELLARFVIGGDRSVPKS